jgi:integrase/recombinase XerD
LSTNVKSSVMWSRWRTGHNRRPTGISAQHLVDSIGATAKRRFNPLSTEAPMLRTLFPRTHRKYLSLPLLGPIADGFNDWLASNGFTQGSRKFCMRTMLHVDADLRLRRIGKIAELTHSVLHDCWETFIKPLPRHAGTVRSLERYLVASGLIVDGRNQPPTLPSPTWILIEEYVGHMHEVRGFAASTISHHRFTAQCFLQQLEKSGIALKDSRPSDVEAYVATAGKRLSRASLQHDIGALRGFLRFLAMDGRAPHGLASPIDTPRLYRLEQLPRALPWDTVCALLRSIDTTTSMGKRDYAIFLLIATYGLRASEVVALTLDDIRWRQGSLRIDQRKTSSPLELPLTNEVLSALVKHLKRTPTPAPYRRVFLRMRAPIGVLKATAITEAFQALVRKSGLAIAFQGPHCLRHSYAVHLLKNGTPLKTIGDILGHRTAESTSMYLRLSTGDLREVALAVPGTRLCGKEGRR